MKKVLLLPFLIGILFLLGCPVDKDITGVDVMLTCAKRNFNCDSIVVLCVNENDKQEIEIQKVQMEDSSFVVDNVTVCLSRWKGQNVKEGDTVIIYIEIKNTDAGLKKIAIDTIEIEYSKEKGNIIHIGNGYPFVYSSIKRKIPFGEYTGSAQDTLYIAPLKSID